MNRRERRLYEMKKRVMGEDAISLEERIFPRTMPTSLHKDIMKLVAKYWYEVHAGTADVKNKREVYSLISKDMKVNKKLMAFFKGAAKLANVEFGDDAVY